MLSSNRQAKRATAGEGAGGFTLVELLVVVAIVGILVGIAIPNYMAYKRQAADADALASVRHVSQAFESWYVEHQTYAGATIADLVGDTGFRESPNVQVSIDAQDEFHYEVSATATGGNGTIHFDSSVGEIVGP